MRKKQPTSLKLAAILVATSFYSSTAIAQSGINDATFNIPDNGKNAIYKGSDGSIVGSALQSNNKIVLIGGFTHYNSVAASRIVRLNENGNTDINFNSGTGFNNTPTALLIQPNNRIIVGGAFTTYNGIAANRLVRLKTSGERDTSFKVGSGLNGNVQSMVLQPDGKVLIIGDFNTFDGTAVKKLIRLTPGGKLDNTFQLFDTTYTRARRIALQSDGKILVCFQNLGSLDLIRLNSDGTKDNSYHAVVPFTGDFEIRIPVVEVLRFQADGQLLLGGSVFFGNAPGMHFLRRITATGQSDTTFHSPYNEYHAGKIYSLNLQSNGKIIVGGNGNGSDNGFGLATICFVDRLNADGSIDNTFLQINKLRLVGMTVLTTSIQPDGKIIAAGGFPEYNTYTAHNIVRLNTDGTLDLSFNKTTGVNGDVKASAIQADGKIVIGGNFSAIQYNARNHIARLRSNGTLDPSFNPGTGTNGYVNAIAIQPDKKIIIAGSFSTYNNQPVGGIVRVNVDGSIDNSFNAGTGITAVYSVSLQADNKLIVGGEFLEIGGTSRTAVARLHVDGSLDTSFTSPLNHPYTNLVYSSFVLPSGKILVGGNFEVNQNSLTRADIVRLNSNGTLDSTFKAIDREYVRSIVLQPDGKILLGGGRNEPGQFPYAYVTRYASDGTRDTSFISIVGPYQTYLVQSITLLNSGKIIVAGRFDEYNNTPVKNIMQLHADGTVDTNFVGNTDGPVYTTQLVANEKVVIGGAFHTYTGITRNNLARITTNEPYAYAAVKQEEKATLPTTQSAFAVYPNPASTTINFDNLNAGSTITITNLVGAVVYTEQITTSKSSLNVSNYSNGIYFITQTANGERHTSKFIVNK